MNFTQGFPAVGKKHDAKTARNEIESLIGKRQTLSICLTGRSSRAALPGPLLSNQQQLGT